MKVIGLTGGIGSGKSTVAQLLAELGAVILDSDKIGHEVLKNAEAKQEIVAAFGEKVLDQNGNIDRKKLSAVVFKDASARTILNTIVHPRMYEITLQKIWDCKLQDVDVVVLEVPLLLESGLIPIMDEVWITVASEATVLERVKNRSGLKDTETLARIHSQMPPEELKKLANVVIDTDCSLDELKAKVKEQWERLLSNKDDSE